MVVPFKSAPCFQQDAIQQRTVPTLSKMSLNLTSKRKVWLMMTGYFLLLKPHQHMKLLWNSFFHHLVHPNPSTFDSLRTIHGGLTKHGLLRTVKELRSIIFLKNTCLQRPPLHHFTFLGGMLLRFPLIFKPNSWLEEKYKCMCDRVRKTAWSSVNSMESFCIFPHRSDLLDQEHKYLLNLQVAFIYMVI